MQIVIEKNDYLVLPVVLDALCVPVTGLPAIGPFADFTRLPYTTRNPDGSFVFHNEGTPYLSDAVLSTPFNDESALLEHGMHLHWALPDALVKSRHKQAEEGEQKVEFPAVPNRWLVHRKSKSAALADKFWMVHSDFLWPEGTIPADIPADGPYQKPYITHHHQTPDGPGHLPFRYQGLVTNYVPGENIVLPDGGEHLEILTAVGYGEPLFAGLYANCRSIFGMWDDLDGKDPADLDLQQIEYEVIGWYADVNQDILYQFIDNIFQFIDTSSIEKYYEMTPERYLAEEYGWSIAPKGFSALPGRILCRARLRFTDARAPVQVPDLAESIDIGTGNTGTEALSAYIAHLMAGDNKAECLRLENQLESLHLKLATNDHFLDLGPLFEEYRHTKSFRSVSGGRLWALRPESAEEAKMPHLRDFHIDTGAATLFLPDLLVEVLNMANVLQNRFNQTNAGIAALQRQIFTDWHKYMVCCYHDEGQGNYPDIDKVRLHIEKLMDLLTLMQAYAGKIRYSNETGRWSAEKPFVLDDLPSTEGLLHLLPVEISYFRSWCERVSKKDKTLNSLAYHISERLNYIAEGLQFRQRMIHSLRGFLPNLESNNLSLEDLTSKTEQIERLIFESTESAIVGLPQRRFIPELNDLKERYSGMEELLDEAKEWLLNRLKPLVNLPVLHLQATKAPRYYQPNEPVILLAGPAIKSTSRHGMDGRDSEGLLLGKYCRKAQFDALLTQGFLEEDDHFLHASNGNHWHTLFFEWEVRMNHLESNANHNPDTLAYAPDFITHQFSLDETRSEFLVQNQNSLTRDSAAYSSGRSILLPYAEQQLMSEIEGYLISYARQFLQGQQAAGAVLTDNEQQLLLKGEEQNTDRTEWLGYFNSDKDRIISYFDALHQADLVKAYLGYPVTDPAATGLEGIRQRHLEQNNGSTVDAAGFWNDNKDTILDWFNEKHDTVVEPQSILHTLGLAEQQLQNCRNAGIQIQTQSLSGFNQALIMLRQPMQMEVAEPNALEAYRDFSKKVALHIGTLNQAIGYPNLDFNPLRTGKMEITRLRLVDTFGRVHPLIDLTRNNLDPGVIKPERMRSADNQILLPARITQPARLNIRWLSKDENDVEVNDHPFTSPICGWVIINHVENSLVFYRGNGEPIGSIDIDGKWRVFPGLTAPLLVEDIPDVYLRKLCTWIVNNAKTQGSIEELIDDWERVMENIDPAGFAQHHARSLLIARPLALVQVSVDIELQSWPAVHQDWVHFSKVVSEHHYQTDAFMDVEIPIRIGELHRLQDGVVSFWLDEGPSLGDRRFSPSNKLTYNQALSTPHQRLSVLMDPRGSLHCTTGILPTKAITIPREQYSEALKNIQIAFLASPVISAPRKINLALPEEEGFTWTWLQRDESVWTELTQYPALREEDVLAAFSDGKEVWQRLVNGGWVQLLDAHSHLGYLLDPAERREGNGLAYATDNDDDKARWQKRQAEVEKVVKMLTREIRPPSFEGLPAHTQEIREGWLMLKPVGEFDNDPMV